MTGFEYAVACNMLMHGMEKEALEIVRSVRARYDGYKREHCHVGQQSLAGTQIFQFGGLGDVLVLYSLHGHEHGVELSLPLKIGYTVKI